MLVCLNPATPTTRTAIALDHPIKRTFNPRRVLFDKMKHNRIHEGLIVQYLNSI